MLVKTWRPAPRAVTFDDDDFASLIHYASILGITVSSMPPPLIAAPDDATLAARAVGPAPTFAACRFSPRFVAIVDSRRPRDEFRPQRPVSGLIGRFQQASAPQPWFPRAARGERVTPMRPVDAD